MSQGPTREEVYARALAENLQLKNEVWELERSLFMALETMEGKTDFPIQFLAWYRIQKSKRPIRTIETCSA